MEFNHTMPIYLQVINDIKKDMIKGKLKLGERLPSARDLAMHYQINPNTSNRIYRELEQLQLCYTKRGLGTYVTEDHAKLAEIRTETADEVLEHFIHEMNDLGYTREEVLEAIEQKYREKEGML